MAKSQLSADLSVLESEIIESLIAGHKEWRPDLAYPESHSDMQGAVRGMLRMFDVRRLALPRQLSYVCHQCRGACRYMEDNVWIDCPKCRGYGYVKELPQ